MIQLVLLSALVAVALAQPLELDFDLKHWQLYKMEHGKKYDNETEELRRRATFLNNVNMVREHNAKYEQGQTTYQMRINKFSDMTPQEVFEKMNGLRFPANYQRSGKEYVSSSSGKLPKAVDWRMKGAVTPIKDQGPCGSCWAFSATGSLEAQMFFKTKKLVQLSEQNLVDCSRNQGNDGCNGGFMDSAFTYIKENNGIDTETSYPYVGKDLTCKYKPADKGGYDNGFVDLPSGKEDKLQEAVALKGPVSIGIDANHNSYIHYWKGVYTEVNCRNKIDELDHAVLVIGYGSMKKGGDYWIVKNSWSTGWGDDGYMLMARNKDNMCGVATAASLPAM